VADPLNLSVFAVEALNEGIKFLYGQATELLERRRERKDGIFIGAEIDRLG
jgi:hypothetical protein